MGGAYSTYGDRRGVYGVFGWETWGKEIICKTQVYMGDNIKMDIEEVRWGIWTGSIWLRIGTGGVNL